MINASDSSHEASDGNHHVDAALAVEATDIEPGDDDALDESLDEADPSTAVGKGQDERADDAVLRALLSRIIYQDEVAFAAFYRCLSSRIFAQALRITREVGCAEEVVEDVFWQVWRQAPRYDAERGCVLAWVRRIARSRALDALRAMGRNPLHAAVELESAALIEIGSHEDGPQHRAESAQSAALIEQALTLLDPLRRQLVVLSLQRGYSQSEIAEQTGLPLGTVKSHIRRALALMKASIEAASGAQPLARG